MTPADLDKLEAVADKAIAKGIDGHCAAVSLSPTDVINLVTLARAALDPRYAICIPGDTIELKPYE